MFAEDLIKFENEIIEGFKEGNTYGPVHLSGGNEKELIEIFKNINKEDWVFTTHRSHYHALLKSNNPKWLKKEILSGYSSHINSKKYKIFSSAIVGGCIPIALGTAMSIKLKGGSEKVYCFVGDMAAEMGQFNEAFKYALWNNLPIVFIVENNSMGCDTPTATAWGNTTAFYAFKDKHLIVYNYIRVHNHYGVGCLVNLKNNKKTTGGMYG